MNNLDFANRYMYLGSAAFPPCNKINFWQQLRTVYPIKPKHVAAVKNVIWSKFDVLKNKENYRGIYPINGH